MRTFDSELILNHDPLKPGVKFYDWLKHYKHSFLIINVKEDGLETHALDLMNEFGIDKFFFLDQPVPSLFKAAKIFPDVCCARISDLESIESAIKMNVSWVWLDSLSGNWDYLLDAIEKLSRIGIKMCLVSPELHRLSFEQELSKLRSMLNEAPMKIDAVCTKYPKKWEF